MAPKVILNAPNKLKAKSDDGGIKKKCISYGSDFCGLGTSGIAMQKLTFQTSIRAVHNCSCDKARFANALVKRMDPPAQWYQCNVIFGAYSSTHWHPGELGNRPSHIPLSTPSHTIR